MNDKELTRKDQENQVYEYPDYEQELLDILRSDKSDEEKLKALGAYHANDIADVLPKLSKLERHRLYQLIGMEEVSEIFSYLDEPSFYLDEIGADKAADVLEQMDAVDAVDVLEDVDQVQQKIILAHMDKASREEIRLIQSYEENEIGSYMTTNYIEIRRGVSVKAAMRLLKAQAAENDHLSTLYVLEEDGTFYGAITLQDLFIARKDDDLEDITTTSYPYVYDHENVSDCMEQLKDYAEDSIPVLDKNRRMLGVVTAQALAEAVEEELNEDYAKLAALSDSEDLKEPLIQSIRKRLPWLLVLMVLGLLVSTVVGMFDGVMAKITIVVAFQSLILDMAGNVGTQSLAVTVRVLADEVLTGKDRVKLLLKEGRVGACNGLLMGLMSCVAVSIYVNMTTPYNFMQSLAIGGCLGAAMLLAMLISSIMGTAIPMGIKAAGFDPAVASGPLITTLNDLVAVVSYYGLAVLMLIPLLT